MGEWEGLSDDAKAMIPESVIDIGDKAMLDVDDKLITACADATEYIDLVLGRLIDLADNIRLNNSELGEAAAMVALLKLTEKLSMTNVGAPLMLARLVTRTAWAGDR